MNTPDTSPLQAIPEAHLASWLLSVDELLAAGFPPVDLRGAACVQRLHELWPRPPLPAGTNPQLATDMLLVSGECFTQLGRFHIRHELGRGGFGCVYLADDPVLEREVALKLPRLDVLLNPALRDRFRHEAQIAARLDHPYIVPIYEAGTVGGMAFIASAYCPGLSLATWLQKQTKPLPLRVAATWMAQLADAVQHAHSRGVLHRDLKPANILLQIAEGSKTLEKDSDSPSLQTTAINPETITPKITDFGLAKYLLDEDGSATQSGTVLGTASYMAPEQAEGRLKEISTAVDIYALGAILYEMLTNKPPFLSENSLATLEQVRRKDPLPPRSLRADVPADLETICLKCLAKEPGQRYASAAALAEDLRRWLAGEPIHGRRVGPVERLWFWARRRPGSAALVAGACMLLLASLALITLLWQWAEFRGEQLLVQKQQLHEEIRQRTEAQRRAEQFTEQLFLTSRDFFNFLAERHQALGPEGNRLYIAMYENAKEWCDRLLQSSTLSNTCSHYHADLQLDYATVSDYLHHRDAPAEIAKAWTMAQRLHEIEPDNIANQFRLARAYYLRAKWHPLSSEADSQAAIALLGPIGVNPPHKLRLAARRELVSCYINMAVQKRDQGHAGEALQDIDKAVVAVKEWNDVAPQTCWHFYNPRTIKAELLMALCEQYRNDAERILLETIEDIAHDANLGESPDLDRLLSALRAYDVLALLHSQRHNLKAYLQTLEQGYKLAEKVTLDEARTGLHEAANYYSNLTMFAHNLCEGYDDLAKASAGNTRMAATKQRFQWAQRAYKTASALLHIRPTDPDANYYAAIAFLQRGQAKRELGMNVDMCETLAECIQYLEVASPRALQLKTLHADNLWLELIHLYPQYAQELAKNQRWSEVRRVYQRAVDLCNFCLLIRKPVPAHEGSRAAYAANRSQFAMGLLFYDQLNLWGLVPKVY